MNRHARGTKQPTAPKLVRQVARAGRLDVENLANAIMDGQPESPTPPEAEAMMRRLIETEQNARPGIDEDALVSNVNERVQELIGAGDSVIAALSERLVDDFIANRARVATALMGARWHPTPPTVPKPARIEAIANVVFSVTGSTRVGDEAVESIYRWLFGDEALYLHEMELRVEAGKHIVANPELQEVVVRHPDTGEAALVTRAEVSKHGETDLAVMAAAHSYVTEQARLHGRVMLLIDRYARANNMTVGEALDVIARENGIDPTGYDWKELVDVLWAAVETGPPTAT